MRPQLGFVAKILVTEADAGWLAVEWRWGSGYTPRSLVFQMVLEFGAVFVDSHVCLINRILI